MKRLLLLPTIAMALVGSALADNDGIFAYDDFSGAAGDLNGRKTPRGEGQWFTTQNTKALVLNGNGHAVMHGDSKPEDGRKRAWLEALPEGDSEVYYVAARLSYDGNGWGAIGFGGPNNQTEPLLASALFAVRKGKHGGVGFIWTKDGTPDGVPADMYPIPSSANYQAGEPGTIAISYNTITGSLRFLYNEQLVYETERYDLPVGRAVISFITDNGAMPDTNFFDSIVVANKEVEMPAE